jgi:hypothetical protein
MFVFGVVIRTLNDDVPGGCCSTPLAKVTLAPQLLCPDLLGSQA